MYEGTGRRTLSPSSVPEPSCGVPGGVEWRETPFGPPRRDLRTGSGVDVVAWGQLLFGVDRSHDEVP